MPTTEFETCRLRTDSERVVSRCSFSAWPIKLNCRGTAVCAPDTVCQGSPRRGAGKAHRPASGRQAGREHFTPEVGKFDIWTCSTSLVHHEVGDRLPVSKRQALHATRCQISARHVPGVGTPGVGTRGAWTWPGSEPPRLSARFVVTSAAPRSSRVSRPLWGGPPQVPRPAAPRHPVSTQRSALLGETKSTRTPPTRYLPRL